MNDEPVVPPEEEHPKAEAAEAPASPAAEEVPAVVPEAIAEPPEDALIDREVRRLSRRGFLVAGVGAAAAYGAWRWLEHAQRIGDVPWPLRRGFELNEKIAEAYFRPTRLTRTYPPSALTQARINGGIGLDAKYDPGDWQLHVEGIDGRPPAVLTLDDIKALPRSDMITELRCIEGWSIIVHWTGARLLDLLARLPPPRGTRYVAMETPERAYYVGLDMQSAMHPQTLLAYELNGAPLSWQHGAPLRLAIPVKYGIKNIKRIGTIRYTDARPADFWAERGYDWYAGH